MTRAATVHRAVLAAILVVASLAGSARADEAQVTEQTDERPPPSGTPFLWVGGTLAGSSLLSALGVTVACTLRGIGSVAGPRSDSTICYGVGLGISGSLLVGGIAMLVVGGQERHAYNEWKRGQGDPRLQKLKIVEEHTSFIPLPHGAALGFRASF